MLLSQPKLTLAGCLDMMPQRWANYASDTTTEDIDAALCELERAGYVVTDRITEEVVIRTFVRHDIDPGRFNRNIARGLWSAWKGMTSGYLQHAVIAHLPDFVWEKQADAVPELALDLRGSLWTAISVGNPNDEPGNQNPAARFEPENQELAPPFEPPSTVYRQPSPVSVSPAPSPRVSLGGDANEPGSKARPLTRDQLVDQAIEVAAEREFKKRPGDSNITPQAALGGIRRRITTESKPTLHELAFRNPTWSPQRLADELLPIHERTVSAEDSPALRRAVKDRDCPTCGGSRCEGLGVFPLDPDDRDSPMTNCADVPFERLTALPALETIDLAETLRSTRASIGRPSTQEIPA